MRKLKNWIVSSAKNLWGLNWEAKIGILFLIPPILGVIMFICNLLFSADIGFESFPESWNCISSYDYNSHIPTLGGQIMDMVMVGHMVGHMALLQHLPSLCILA